MTNWYKNKKNYYHNKWQEALESGTELQVKEAQREYLNYCELSEQSKNR